jgi:imidazolonepropionase-like amidohydrolase
MRILRASTVLTGRPGEVIADGEVRIDGGTIVEVGTRSAMSEPPPPDAEIIEYAGCTLMPGMIDSHVHIGFDSTLTPATARSAETDPHLLLRMAENCRKLLSIGVTTARDLGNRDFLDIELRDGIEDGMAIGPHLVVATRPITNSGGHCWYMGGEADDEPAIRRVARENLRAGADCLKVMATGGNLTPVGPKPWIAQFNADQIRVAVQEASMRGKHVAAHAHGVDGIRCAVEAGVDTIEHCSFQTGDFSLAAPTPRKIDMDTIDQIAAQGIFVCPTVSGMVWKIRDMVGPGWVDSMLERLRIMKNAGVRLIAGTDSGFGARGHENRMDDYIDGLEVWAAAGFSAPEIIETATVSAAEACGIGTVAGSLDVGKRADILAVRGNPHVEISAVRNLEAVLVSGRFVTQREVDTVVSSGAMT